MSVQCAIPDRPLTLEDLPDRLPAVLPEAVPVVPALLGASPVGELPAGTPSGLPAPIAGELAWALAGPSGRAPDTVPSPVLRAVPDGQVDLNAAECARLRGFLEQIPDHRDLRGVRHRLAYLLAIPVAAMMAGERSPEQIGEWAATAPPEVLIALGGTARPDGSVPAPDTATIARALTDVDSEALDRALCGWTAALRRAQVPGLLRCLHIDGKAQRGAAARGGKAPMLLAARCDLGTVVAQLPVSAKTNEIPVLRRLLDRITDLAGVVITADQLHTQRKTATKIRRHQAHYVFTVGNNQPKLFAALDALPWEQIAIESATVDRGHGRIELRTIRALPATDTIKGLFPHVEQVFLLERHIYAYDGTMIASAAVLGITSLPADQADAAAIAAYVRGHWSVEVLHNLRDTVLGEDASRVKAASRAIAALRNLVISVLSLHGITSIARQLRACHRDPYRLPLLLLGLITPTRDPAATST